MFYNTPMFLWTVCNRHTTNVTMMMMMMMM